MRAVAATFLFTLVGLLVLGIFIQPLIIRAMILGALFVAASWLRTRRAGAGTRGT